MCDAKCSVLRSQAPTFMNVRSGEPDSVLRMGLKDVV